MAKSYWSGTTAAVLLLKAVVTAAGRVIGKNYNPQELTPGDLGLSVRVDRAKLESMTPEQRTMALTVGREMASEFLGALGEETDEGLRPGMVVEVSASDDTRYGILVRVTDSVVVIRSLRPNGKTYLTDLPRAKYTVEELEDAHGMSGLAGHLMRESPDEHFTEAVLALVEDEDTLAYVANARWVVDAKDKVRLVAVERLTDPDKIVECAEYNVGDDSEVGRSVLRTLLSKITDQAELVRLSDRFVQLQYEHKLPTIMEFLTQETLVSIVRSNEREKLSPVRRAAVAVLDGEWVDRLLKDRDPHVRMVTLGRASQEVIERLVTSDPSLEVRAQAARHMNSEDLLFALAKEDETIVAPAAFDRLVEIFINKPGFLPSISNQRLVELGRIAKSEYVRDRAARL